MNPTNKCKKLHGTIRNVFNAGEIATIGKCVNYNAEILENLIERVEVLEKQMEDRKRQKDGDE